jgi:hypothetical protein
MRYKRFLRWKHWSAIVVPMLASSCVHVHTDPIEVKPITLNVNVNLKVDKDLDDVFAFQNKDAATTAPVAP